jgi:hypothetical protein
MKTTEYKTRESKAAILIGNSTVCKRRTPMLLVGFDFLTYYPSDQALIRKYAKTRTV